VTIWFLVDGEIVYLATANASRQWVRNVQANPSISFASSRSGGGTALRRTPTHSSASTPCPASRGPRPRGSPPSSAAT
jgi:hypothetical protein